MGHGFESECCTIGLPNWSFMLPLLPPLYPPSSLKLQMARSPKYFLAATSYARAACKGRGGEGDTHHHGDSCHHFFTSVP